MSVAPKGRRAAGYRFPVFEASVLHAEQFIARMSDLGEALRREDHAIDVFDLIERIDDRCFRPLAENNRHRLDEYLSSLRDGLATESDRFGRSSKVRSLIRSIGDAACHGSSEDVPELLEARNRGAFEMFRGCAADWGGASTRRRAKSLESVPIATGIRDTAGPLEVSFRGDSILVEAGEAQGSLRRALNLEFEFLHEYLSHGFPRWDDEESVLSESFLLKTALAYLEAGRERWPYQASIAATSPGHGESPRLRQAQWYLRVCDRPDCFSQFVLDWLAEADRWNEDDNQMAASTLFGWAKERNTALANRFFCDGCGSGIDARKTHDRILEWAQDRLRSLSD